MKIRITEALGELEEDNSVYCQSCSSTSDEGFEPYCRSCHDYWTIDAPLLAQLANEHDYQKQYEEGYKFS